LVAVQLRSVGNSGLRELENLAAHFRLCCLATDLQTMSSQGDFRKKNLERIIPRLACSYNCKDSELRELSFIG
jgi:hypothetical protein